MPLVEDLVPFNWATAHVQHVGPNWIIADGAHSIMGFGGNLAEANRALAEESIKGQTVIREPLSLPAT